MTQLRLVRPGSWWQDRYRAYQVHLDGKIVGQISQDGELCVDISPGVHQLQLKIDWCSSPMISFEASEGSRTEIACGPNGHPMLALVYVTLLINDYIWVKPAAREADGLAS